jgi:hypothetical protein
MVEQIQHRHPPFDRQHHRHHRVIRVANMPKTLWEVWLESWRESLSIEDYTLEYSEWINTLWQHKTMELWNKAAPSGVFGEHY